MNAAVKITDAEPVASLLDEFRECAEDYASFYVSGWLEKADAVDCAQRHAELWGVVDLYGQDAVQAELAAAFTDAPPLQPPEPGLRRLQAVQPKRTYRTPQATIDAFWYAVSLNDEAYLTRWLKQHPKDCPYLQQLLEDKCRLRRN